MTLAGGAPSAILDATNSPAASRVASGHLRDFVTSLFVRVGVRDDDARRVAQGLVDADVEGTPSHGVMLVEMYVRRLQAGSVAARGEVKVVSDQGATVVLDGNNLLGLLTADHAMNIAIARAKTFGIGFVAVRNCFHFGAAKRYALAAASLDCIGVAICNTRPLMPAPGGAERIVGNNPIAIALPTDGLEPLVLDMATSEAAMGRIRMAARSDVPIPRTWAVRDDGSPTTDPTEAITGMLLPTGGAKGFGLAVMIDLICGVLSGGGFGDAVQPLYGDFAQPYNCSHAFLAINTGHFTGREIARQKATAAANRIRRSRRAPGTERIFAPGEPEWDRRSRAGEMVVLDQTVLDGLVRLARELDVPDGPLTATL